MSDYSFSGRNYLAREIPAVLKCKAIIEYCKNPPYPCRVYDSKGKLKYELSTEQLLKKYFKKNMMSFNKFFKL